MRQSESGQIASFRFDNYLQVLPARLRIVGKPIKSCQKILNKEKNYDIIQNRPSILSADYANFEAELKKLEATGAEYAHIDIMDGHFVPNISFGAGVVASMRPHSKLVFDCHLMVSNPEHHIEEFARAGADIISIHARSDTSYPRSAAEDSGSGSRA